jgi:hypothetical protein
MDHTAIEAFQAREAYEAKAQALRRRFMTDAARRRPNAGLEIVGALWRRLMLVYWTVCCTIVLAGANVQYPEIGQRALSAFRDPTMELTRPFANCEIALDQGYWSIPKTSPAYVAWQDRGGDGRACEPSWGHPPNGAAVIRRAVNRLEGL